MESNEPADLGCFGDLALEEGVTEEAILTPGGQQYDLNVLARDGK
jgi:hypothetical protein